MTKNNSAKPGNNYPPASLPVAPATRKAIVGNGAASSTEVENEGTEPSFDLPLPPSSNAGASWRQRFGLRAKVTAIAIALGVLPILAVGGIAYQIADKQIGKEVFQNKRHQAENAAENINRFIQERYGDVEVISKLPAFTNPRVGAELTLQDKQAIIDRYMKSHQAYDNMALVSVDGKGTNLVQNSGQRLARGIQNHLYFKEALRTDSTVIAVERSLTNKKLNIFLATPVKDSITGKTIAVFRTRLSLSALESLLKNLASEGNNYYFVGSDGKIFASSQKNAIEKDAASYFSSYSELHAARTLDVKLGVRRADRTEEVIAYSPPGKIEGLSELPWETIITTDKAVAFALQAKLFETLVIGAGLTALVVGALAAYLANRLTRPILTATDAVEKLGLGELDTRIAVSGTDEFAVLGSNINLMADEIQTFLAKQADETRRAQLIAEITSHIRQTLKTENILKTAVREIHRLLKCDRVVIVQLDTDIPVVVAESVAAGWPKLLTKKVTHETFKQRYIELDNQHPVRIINNIDEASMTDIHRQWLIQNQVKAKLASPIRVSEQLYGVLMIHQCQTTRDWQPSEFNLFAQLATQVGIALEQANLLKQIETARQQSDLMALEQKQQKEAIQMQLIELLSDVDAASQGDLTVRADVTASEIGTVGDFFNSIIQSLRQVVSQVIAAAAQVNASVATTEGGIRDLADKALQQAEDITNTLNSVEQMTLSIQEVANSARTAAEVARSAAITADAGGAAMDRTVQSILNLRETIAETVNKVKRLGESSQQISKAVSLIKQIALQTNVLAINASFEAARAGEEGRGFAVVAEEVGKLAARAAAASQSIQRIVENIQLETKEVVSAMELGTTQVVDGTRQVEAAKQSLEQIVEVSRQIDDLVQSISDATVSQAETSQTVMNLMNDIAQVSKQTSQSSHQVSESLQQTVEVTRQLQESVGVFKVD